jgi:hypothetical protein
MAYENESAPNPYVTTPGQPTPDANATNAQQAQAYAQIRAAYKRFLNREPSDSEIESHLAGRYDSATVQRALQTIQGSEERGTVNQQAGGAPDQTAPPAFTPREQRDQLQWSNVGKLEGFQVGSDYGGDVKARNSVKNTFGRIASRYPATPEGLRQVVADPEFQRAFPNARLVDHPTGDKIDFGGVLSDFESGSPVGVVDVGRSFSGANQKEQTAFVWQPEDTSADAYQRTQAAILNRGGAQTGQEGPGARVSDAVLNQTQPAQDPMAQYLAYLQSLMTPAPPYEAPPQF